MELYGMTYALKVPLAGKAMVVLAISGARPGGDVGHIGPKVQLNFFPVGAFLDATTPTAIGESTPILDRVHVPDVSNHFRGARRRRSEFETQLLVRRIGQNIPNGMGIDPALPARA